MKNEIMRTTTLLYVVLVFWGTSAALRQSRNYYSHSYEVPGITYSHHRNLWTSDPRPPPPVARHPDTLGPGTRNPEVYNQWIFDPRPRPPVARDPDTLGPGTLDPEVYPWTFDPRPPPPVARHPDTLGPGTLDPEVYNPDPRNLEFAPGSGFLLPQTSVHKWIKGGILCNQAIIATIECIGKIEHVILQTPMQLHRGIRIPNRVVQIAMTLAGNTIPLVSQTKRFLEQFFITIFELPAKALYGTMSIFSDLLTMLQDWGYNCLQRQRDRRVCSVLPPNVGGFGPCAGTWPCLPAVACRTAPCLAVIRKRFHLLPHSGQEASKNGRK